MAFDSETVAHQQMRVVVDAEERLIDAKESVP